jgi:hypothetical protein
MSCVWAFAWQHIPRSPHSTCGNDDAMQRHCGNYCDNAYTRTHTLLCLLIALAAATIILIVIAAHVPSYQHCIPPSAGHTQQRHRGSIGVNKNSEDARSAPPTPLEACSNVYIKLLRLSDRHNGCVLRGTLAADPSSTGGAMHTTLLVDDHGDAVQVLC